MVVSVRTVLIAADGGQQAATACSEFDGTLQVGTAQGDFPVEQYKKGGLPWILLLLAAKAGLLSTMLC